MPTILQFPLLLLLVLAITATLLANPAHGAAFTNTLSIPCQNATVTLVIKQGTYTVPGQLTFQSRLYHYNNTPMVPGPTIRMTPGSWCNMRIQNSLSTTSPVANCTYHVNSFHCPDTTNLHVHGLHVSPTQDNINTTILPGASLDYNFTVPKNHLMGTFWYHAHKHGSSALQVGGGLVGMLIMEPGPGYTLPADLAALYNYTSGAAQVNEMVFQHLNFNGTDTGVSAAFTMYDYLAISNFYSTTYDKIQTISPNLTLLNTSSPLSFYTVNNQYQPTVTVTRGQATLFRMVNAGTTRILELEPVDPQGYCTMQLVARDGIFQYTPYPNITSIVLSPGNRADVALLCSPSTPSGTVITMRAYPNPLHDALINTLNRVTQSNVFTISIASSSTSSVGLASSQATLPSYLADLRSNTPVYGQYGLYQIDFLSGDAGEMVNRIPFVGFDAWMNASTQQYMEIYCLNKTYDILIVPPVPNVSIFGGDPAATGATGGGGGAGGGPPGGGGGGPGGPGPMMNINMNMDMGGMNMGPPATDNLDPIRATTPASAPTGGQGTGSHIYHHHIHSFQYTGTTGVSDVVNIARVGEWRDVIPTFPYGTGIRFMPLDFTGDMVIHCHILQHEDMGMMALYHVNDTCSNIVYSATSSPPPLSVTTTTTTKTTTTSATARASNSATAAGQSPAPSGSPGPTASGTPGTSASSTSAAASGTGGATSSSTAKATSAGKRLRVLSSLQACVAVSVLLITVTYM